MKKGLCLLLCAIMILMAGTAFTESAEQPAYTLDRMVVLSRHNIRSPLSATGSLLDRLTPHQWFEWTSNTSELSLRGAMLETTMGQYFRLWLEKEGLFPENYLPEDGAVRFYANGLQRTQATARYFSAGLLPVAVVPVERKVEYNELDGTFLPLLQFSSEEYLQDVLKEISEMSGGNGMNGIRDSVKEGILTAMAVTDMEKSEAYQAGEVGNLLEDDNPLTLEPGKEPAVGGPLKTLTSVADALVLQYYEEPDNLKAAFGHEITEKDWAAIGSILSKRIKGLYMAPSLAPHLAHPILEEIYREMNTEGRKFSFLCGHDSTVAPVLGALGVKEYTLPGAIETVTPIGVKLVFERWIDREGKAFWKASLVYQSVDQLRSIEPLSLENPPMICALSFTGIEANGDGMIPEEAMMNLFRSAIDKYDELVEKYTEEEMPEAA